MRILIQIKRLLNGESEVVVDQPLPRVESGRQGEVLLAKYTLAMRNAMSGRDVRPEIRLFLMEVWAEVLVVSAMRSGQNHPATRVLTQTAANLIHAHSALKQSDARTYASKVLPQIVQRVRVGVASTRLSDSDQAVHMVTLTRCLADIYFSRTMASTQHAVPEPIRAERSTGINVAAMPGSHDDFTAGLVLVEDESLDAWRLWDCAKAVQDVDKLLVGRP
jgi:hypothetical protein